LFLLVRGYGGDAVYDGLDDGALLFLCGKALGFVSG
jgi:hypothetical protein